MINTIQLTETEVEFLYSKVKLSKDLPKDLLTKLEEIVKENRQKYLEEYQSYSEDLKKFNSDKFLQKLYKEIAKHCSENYTIAEFMKDINYEDIKIFETIEDWFTCYITRFNSDTYKLDLEDLVQEKINEEDKGKTILHKLLDLQLKEDPNLYLVDNKIVVCYF